MTEKNKSEVPKAVISPDHDAVICEIEIAAPPDRVFRALIEREQALLWGSNESFVITEWEMDPRLGGKWRFTAKERTPSGAYPMSEFLHHGEILEISPPRLLVYSWFTNFHKQPSHQTVVRWDLAPTSAGTRLRVTHSGLAVLPETRKGYSEGWPGILMRIKDFVER